MRLLLVLLLLLDRSFVSFFFFLSERILFFFFFFTQSACCGSIPAPLPHTQEQNKVRKRIPRSCHPRRILKSTTLRAGDDGPAKRTRNSRGSAIYSL